MALPRVSILMGTNKCDDYFLVALNSCLGQTLKNFELVLIASGISDGDFDQLKKICTDPRIFLHRTDIRGLTYALNIGLHYCRGEFVARMDADDIAYPDRLAKQVDFMEQNPDVAVCGSFCDLIDKEQKKVGDWVYPTTDKAIRSAMYWKNTFCHPTVVFRRKVVADFGGYFGYYSEDYALWVLLSENKTIKFANISERLIGYRANATDHPRTKRYRSSSASVAGTQFRQFAATNDFRWFFAALLSMLKIVVYSR